MIEEKITPLTILWIDDEPIDALYELFDDNGFKVIQQTYYEDAIAWLQNPQNRKICDAVILDVNSKKNAEQKQPSMSAFVDCSHIVYSLCEQDGKSIPWFVLTMGTGYDGATSLEYAIPKESWTKKQYYIKVSEKDQQALVDHIKELTKDAPNIAIRNRYAGVWDCCDDKAEIALFKIIDAVEKKNIFDTSIFIDMRIALNATVSRGKECGLIPDFVTKANEAKFILIELAKSEEEIVPSYISYTYATLCDIVNNGCHPEDENPKHLKVHPDVSEGRAPYLIYSAFNQLLTLLKWFSAHYTSARKVQETKAKVAKALGIPMVGEKIAIKKDRMNYYYEKCVTKGKDIINKSEEELEYLTYCVLSVSFNATPATSNQYPYFIAVRKI